MSVAAWSHRYTRRIHLFFAVLLAALMSVALVPTLVSAHVALVGATPVPGSTVGQPPTMIRIRFDQIPDPKFNEIALLDTSGQTVAGGAATSNVSDPSVVEVTLKGKIAPGLYTVAWQALANDGHLTKGNYSFTLSSGLGPAPPADPLPVGAPTTGAPAASTGISSGNPSVLAVIVRWLRYLALGVLIGAFGLAALVIRPMTANREGGDGAWRRAIALLQPWAFGGVMAFVVAHIATLFVQAATVADISITAVRGDTLRRLLFDTTYGGVWRIIAIVALILLVGMLAAQLPFWRAHPPIAGIIATARPVARAEALPDSPPPAVWPWQLGLGVAFLLALAITFSSHAIESQHQPVLALLADAAHLGAMGVWFGGLVVLLVTVRRWLRPLDQDEQVTLLSATVGRFSNVALVSVGTLIATGIYAMTIHTTRATILNTSYGQTLLIKHALILPLLGTAALNLFVTKPRLGQSPDARRWLSRLLMIEAALGLAVLLVTATLTQLPPAHLLTGANAAAADPRLNNAVIAVPPVTQNVDADLSSGPQSAEMQDAAGMTVLLTTTTGRDGSALDANIVDPNAFQPLPDVQRVTALITFAGADLGQTSVVLPRDASGHYHTTGIFFPIKGVWNIQLVIRRANIADDARLNFSFTSDPARFQTTGRPISTVTAAKPGFLWPRLLPNAYYGLLLVLIGGALLAVTYRSRFRETLSGRTFRVYRLWSLGALLVGVMVFGFYSTDRTPTTGITNPIPNTAATLATGQQLFAQNCAVCHGPLGKGDGPLAQNLNPRPVDLTSSHLTTHTDGDLYWWVSHGIAGTGMPAFSGTLSDQDLWALIRYIRTLRAAAS